MSSALEASLQVGPHIIVREGAITKVVLQGTIAYEHVEKFLVEYQRKIDEQGFVLLMMDVRQGGDMAMPARRLATKWGSERGHCVRSAIFGATFFFRTAIELLNRASHLMTGNAPTITFVATYEEARDWLIAQIPHLPQKKGQHDAGRTSG